MTKVLSVINLKGGGGKIEEPLPVFDTVIGEHVDYARAAKPWSDPHTVKERWGKLGEQWMRLAGEIRQKLEELK